MAPSNSEAESRWISIRREHEGFPLYLRYPAALDYALLQAKLPFRSVVTHAFSLRRFDGAPEPKYNDTLEAFDGFLTGYFASPDRGQIVLVETFGGERNYYFYIADPADTETLLTTVRRQFPGQRVDAECEKDSEWRFIQKYRAEYLESGA